MRAKHRYTAVFGRFDVADRRFRETAEIGVNARETGDVR